MSGFSVVHSKGHFRPMLRLALPVLGEESLTLLVGWTDLWLVGQYIAGEESKAAMGLMSYVMWLIPSMFAAISIGTVAIVSRLVGAGKPRTANRLANQAVSIGILACVVVTALTFWFQQPFIRAMNLEGQSADFASRYLNRILPVIPLIMIQQVGAASLRGAGDTITGLVVKSIVVVLNILFSVLLVTGLWLAPQLGFDGIAMGTAIGHGTGGLILLAVMIRGRAGIRLKGGWLIPRWNLVKKLLRVGLPGGFDIAAVLVCQLMFLSFVNSLGKLQAAAHAVAIQIEAVAYLPGTAFQVAVATMAGQFLGARMPGRAMRSVFACTLAGLFVVSTSGGLVYLLADRISGFFIHASDAPTIQLAAELLRIVSWAMPALAVVMVLSGALRGAGDTKWPFVITLTGFLLIRIPLAYYLSLDEVSLLGLKIAGWEMGVQGAWYAMLVDLVCRSLMLSARTLQGGWQRVRV
ncbi:MAG: MATE family efflux transporter [Planctomycetota bacterium]|nr:MATE family efflux transporter [Planctomycetota bacterium]